MNDKSNHSNLHEKLITSSKNSSKTIINIKTTDQTSNSSLTTQLTNTDHLKTKSFTETTAGYKTPKMNQAIVFTIIDGTKQIEYLGLRR